MPVASIVVPAFNVQDTLSQTIEALLAQTFDDFEILIVDDGSTDDTTLVAAGYKSDCRVRIISQRNRGLAGARNTGIDAAKGHVIGFCDADDIWQANKLERHVRHLQNNPHVGVSFSGSLLMDEDGKDLGMAQRPKLNDIDPVHILKRNPVGNGSAAVIRKDVFRDIAYRPGFEKRRDWYFDESFRQSEDIECWMRIALTTDWAFEGIADFLTRYRVNSSGLSANTQRQLDAWDRMVAKLTPLHPAFFARHTKSARAYQLRYLARRAISDRNSDRANEMVAASFRHSWRPLFEEPGKTLSTLGAATLLRYAGPEALNVLMQPKGN